MKRMNMALIFCLALLASPLTVSGQGVADKPNELIPYALGAEWIYNSVSRDESGKVVEKTVETSKVVGIQLIDDEQWYLVNDLDFGLWVRNTAIGEEDADIVMDDETLLLKKERSYLYFKYPAKQGEEWTTIEQSEEDSRQSMRVKQIDAEVTVPAGTFNCIVYESFEDDEEVMMRFYVSPGVGLIKMETLPKLSDNGGGDVLELVKFVPGKK